MPGLLLTMRDLALLESVALYRHLTTEQLQRLHFPSRQTMLRRIRLLSRGGHVRVSPAPSLGTRVVSLTPRGLAAMPKSSGESFCVPRTGARAALFLEHFTAITDFRIRLVETCSQRADIQCLGFIPEFAIRAGRDSGQPRPYIQDVVSDRSLPHGGPLSHIPDGVFALRRGGRDALFFLEADRGTEVVERGDRGVTKLARFYVNYLDSSSYQRYAEDFNSVDPFQGFRVLVVTTSSRRIQNIRERTGRMPGLPAEGRRFIWLATKEAVMASNALECEWVSLDPDDTSRYRISPDRTGEVR